MKEIKLSQGYIALIDDEDYDRVNRLKWNLTKQRSKFRASHHTKKNGRIYMHRYILNVKDVNIQVDHIDGNPLNNQKLNLRLCSNMDNAKNRPVRKDSYTGYKGVMIDKRRKKQYYAQIKNNKKKYWLGYFYTLEEAIMAYNNAALKLHKEYACINKKDFT